MQPHSMCAAAAANYIWWPFKHSGSDPVVPTKMSMRVEYTNREDRQKSNLYELMITSLSTDRNEFKCDIRRLGESMDPCTVTVRRKSRDDLSIKMTHSQKHGAGTWEEFKLSKEKISSGTVINSMWYKNFAGIVKHDKAIDLYCSIMKVMHVDVNVNDKHMKSMKVPATVKYQLKIESVS